MKELKVGTDFTGIGQLKLSFEGINVLSLFDGMSCGQIALERSGIKVANYYASEVDESAIKIAKKNFPLTQHIGDVTKVKGSDFAKIDMLIGGSPCQGFSNGGKGLNFEDPRSKLFFEYVRILNELQEINPDLIFLLENVSMRQEWQDIITSYLKVEPIVINSKLVSAQSRKRVYWTNIPGVKMPEDRGIRLVDILETDTDKKYLLTPAGIDYMNRAVKGGRTHWDFAHHSDTDDEKGRCVTANFRKGVPYNVLIIRDKSKCIRVGGRKSPVGSKQEWDSPFKKNEGDTARRYTPVECERLQTVPDHYTEGVSNSQRYKMLGNGWNVDTIVHILNYMK